MGNLRRFPLYPAAECERGLRRGVQHASARHASQRRPATSNPAAQPGVASIDYHPGFRVGFAKALDECNAVVATFTHYEGEDQSSISTNQSVLIRSMVFNLHLEFQRVSSDWSVGRLRLSHEISLADVDFRWTFENQNDTRLSLLAGVRYASLDQRLESSAPARHSTRPDVQNVHTPDQLRRRRPPHRLRGPAPHPYGLVFYGRTAASLVAGTFRSAYTQTSDLLGPQADTGYPADRVVPMLDAELGTGLSLWNDKLRFTVGYSFSGWFNVVRTDQFIGAVQNNNFTGMSNTLTFDGFVGRVELQF